MTPPPPEAISDVIGSLAPTGPVVTVTDSTVARLYRADAGSDPIVVPAGEAHKTLDTLSRVWQGMARRGLTRQGLVVCLGGGMVTDLGGLAAATYMRGVPYVNVPTTLLGAVDASVGGKTAIDFAGVKNLVGAFHAPVRTVLDTRWLTTLPQEEILSGRAEMVKHALLAQGTAEVAAQLRADASIPSLEELRRSVAVKAAIVAADPREAPGGPRRRLNLGHTAGHALEALALSLGTPVPHGWAVARGLLVSLVLSHMELAMPMDTAYAVARWLVRNYQGMGRLTCRHYPWLLQAMGRDKKNARAGHPRFTLLRDVCQPVVDLPVAAETVTAALDIARDLTE